MNKLTANFDYLLFSQIIIVGDYKNEEYHRNIATNQKSIESIWDKKQEGRSNKLFNGNILNLAVIEKHKDKLILQCHPIQYKHYLAQKHEISLGITPLAVSGLVFYQENDERFFYIGKRSESVTQYPGHYEFIPSGSIDADDFLSGQNIDYEKQLMIELKEELGVSNDQVKSCRCFCLILDKKERVYDIGLEIEVQGPLKVKIQESEYTEVEIVPLSSIFDYIKRQKIVTTSRALFKAWNDF
ncbi:MAG: hypothetical protein K8S18_10755 [Desulfobacula sp.]|nr:hypothetical protein [Desulfobacula sp.]